jgi:2'-5' RNA ligase
MLPRADHSLESLFSEIQEMKEEHLKTQRSYPPHVTVAYRCVVIDSFSRRIVRQSLAKREREP